MLQEQSEFSKKFDKLKIKKLLRNRADDYENTLAEDELTSRIKVRKGFHQNRWYKN